ncbi:tRNA (adenosine(37)-N6)-dimethylallyltransferase MiaA [Helicobacter anseris]|uniref:tRNA dimethylallyltransferase n=1 Tax=Helicobacter anseris TaxID=375926 RepID=A0A3D8J816_9HELI|nr:tRNA (adenosine(37)-N6)-dimethylallyltransferase MiaA [Helicobacter anseris]RDU73256.1 tRNA (adenosine(37)-N6)-dimethylallyltransferase MiaA [Helicobacter anseris]
MKPIKLIAILGSSGSGKSELALKLATSLDAEIFSLDSLSIYKKIDILSAKPSKEEMAIVKHYGIDVLEIDQENNALIFKNLLLEAIKQTNKKILLIVGGSSFYLKAIIEGLSPMPKISKEIKEKVALIKNPYEVLSQKDLDFAKNIKPQDTYRIQKGLEIFYSTHTPPSLYFKKNPPVGFEYPIDTFCIEIQREILRERIIKRTQMMLKNGGIEEIQNLLTIYPKDSQPFKAIGPKECIEFLEQKISFETLETQIITHTMQLAKRQKTFNKTQFKNIAFFQKDDLFDEILRLY